MLQRLMHNLPLISFDLPEMPLMPAASDTAGAAVAAADGCTADVAAVGACRLCCWLSGVVKQTVVGQRWADRFLHTRQLQLQLLLEAWHNCCQVMQNGAYAHCCDCCLCWAAILLHELLLLLRWRRQQDPVAGQAPAAAAAVVAPGQGLSAMQ